MKASLILLILPIVAFAAVLPRQNVLDAISSTTPEPHHDETILDKIHEKIHEIHEKVHDDIKKVEDKIFGGTIHDILEKIKEEIKEKMDEVKKQLDHIKEEAKEKYEEAKQKIDEIIKQLKYKLIEKLAIARMEFQKLEQELGEKIAQLKEEATKKYGELSEKLKEIFEKTRKELQEKLQKAKEQLMQAEEKLKEKISQAEVEFKKVVDEVKEKFGDATEKLKEELAKAEEELKQKISQAQEEYKKIKDQIKEELEKIAEEIRHVIGKRDISDIWNQIKEKLTQIKTKIEETVGKIEKELMEKFQEAKKQFDHLKEELTKTLDEIKKQIQDIIGQVQNDLKQKLDQLKQEYEKLLKETQEKLHQLEEELKKTYGEIKGELEKSISDLKKIIQDKITEAKEKLHQAEQLLKERLDKAKEEFEKTVQETKEKYGPELEKIKEELTKAEQEMKEKLQEAQKEFNKVKEDVKQEIGKLIDEIKKIIGGEQMLVRLALFHQDPEMKMNPGEITEYWGYPSETHQVFTNDGYILTLFRIPYGRFTDNTTLLEHRPVVFLQHGLDGSAADFVVNLPNQAAAFVLADAGYDVWLGNFRGNSYSRGHKSMTINDHAYWEFSWMEMADHDLPAMIDYALNTSKAENLYYVGFSIGATTAFAKLSEDANFAKKVKKFYAMGPMVMTNHVKGPLRWMAPFTSAFQYIFNLVGMNQFQPNQWIMNLASKYFCNNVVTKLICSNTLFLIGGPNSDQLNTTRLPVYLSHSPSGTSTRTMIHIGQMIHTGKFLAFNFGNKKANQQHYYQDTPKTYDVSKITTQITIFVGDQDWLAPSKDIEHLVTQLRNVQESIILKNFNHFDFIWGLHAAPQVYWPIRIDIRQDYKSASH